MFADHIITIAGRTIILTSHDLFMATFSIVSGLIFLLARYFSRKRIVVLKRSSAIDQLTFEVSRLADALERIANRPTDRAVANAMRGQQQLPPPPQRESKGIMYSMFGR